MSPKSSILSLFLVILFIPSLLYGQNTGGSAVDHYHRGSNAQISGDYYVAIEAYKTALEINPRYLEPRAGLAETFFMIGEYTEALEQVKEAQRLDRNNVELVNLEGRILVALGRLNEAASLFERVMEREPNNLNAWFGMAELEIAFGKTATARSRYLEALRVSPQNRRALLSLILLLDEEGMPERAAGFVEDALDYYPNNAQVRYIAAKHYVDRGDYDEAELHARAAVQLDPGYRDANLLLSRIYLETDEEERAVSLLEELISRDRSNSLVWYTLGVAYRRLERSEDALNAFAFAFRYKPDDEISRIAFENLLIEETGLDDPRRERFAEYHFERGEGYQQRNSLSRALNEYRRGLRVAPHSKRGRLLYADIFKIRGFNGKYLSELKVIRDLGYEDNEIVDNIEIQESLLYGRVSDDWGVDQYTLMRHVYRIGLFVGSADLIHMTADMDLAVYLRSAFHHYENIRVSRTPVRSKTFGEAFRAARSDNADFFIIVDFIESDRHFAVKARLYGASTGALFETFSVLRTGNNRVTDSLSLLAENVHQMLPRRGTIIEREFDTALIALGRVDGVAAEDTLYIIKGDELEMSTEGMGFRYHESDLIGEFTVTRTDELVSEGTIRQNEFFDLVNTGDDVIYPPGEESEPEPGADTVPDDLYETIIRIR